MNKHSGSLEFKELRNKLFGLSRLIASNTANLELHRAKVEENRSLILANSIANGTAIRRFADDDIEISLMEAVQASQEVELDDVAKQKAVELMTYEMFLNRMNQKIEGNKRLLEISEKLVAVNAELIAINSLSSELNQSLSLSARPLDEFQKGLVEVTENDCDQEMLLKESEELQSRSTALGLAARDNFAKILDLNLASEKNRKNIARNSETIHAVNDAIVAMSGVFPDESS